MAFKKFKIKDKIYTIEVKECKTLLSKIIGLMFKNNSMPLFFKFNKPKKISLHSFFCVPFIIIWFNKNKISCIKFATPWKFFISNNKKSDGVMEIPQNCKEFKIFSKIIKKSERFKY